MMKMMKISVIILSLSLLPFTAAQVRGAQFTAKTKFDGFVRNEIQVLADAPIAKDKRAVIYNVNKRRLAPEGLARVSRSLFPAPRGAGSFADSQPMAIPDIEGRKKKSSGGMGSSSSSSNTRINFVQDNFDSAVAVDDFNEATTPTLKEEGTVFTFRNFTIGSQQGATNTFFASGVCTRTEGNDPDYRALSYCDFTYALPDALSSGFSASGAVLDAFATTTGGFSGGGILGISGGTGLYFGVTGEVQLTPFFDTTTLTTSGDFFLDAAFYSVNATLLF